MYMLPLDLFPYKECSIFNVQRLGKLSHLLNLEWAGHIYLMENKFQDEETKKCQCQGQLVLLPWTGKERAFL